MPAKILSRAGFQTIGIYRNGWVSPTFGFAHDYDIYERPLPQPVPQTVRLANPTVNERGSDEDAIESAQEFLRFDGHRKRWFLYLHFMDVHEYLYDEQSALFGSTHSDIYDNSVRHVDALIDTLLASLSDAGYRDHTLIIVAADHGEELGERGLDGHARELYRESTEVPFLLSLPVRLEPGIVVNSVTRNVDIWPTVFDLLQLAGAGDVDGRSLVPLILAAARGEAVSDGDHPAFAHLDQTWGRPELPARPTVAVVDGPHRYVRTEQFGGNTEQLFDRSDDPSELRNRASDEPEVMERLRQLADHHLAEKPPWGNPPTRTIDELELNHLRALGYAIP